MLSCGLLLIAALISNTLGNFLLVKLNVQPENDDSSYGRRSRPPQVSEDHRGFRALNTAQNSHVRGRSKWQTTASEKDLNEHPSLPTPTQLANGSQSLMPDLLNTSSRAYNEKGEIKGKGSIIY